MAAVLGAALAAAALTACTQTTPPGTTTGATSGGASSSILPSATPSTPSSSASTSTSPSSSTSGSTSGAPADAAKIPLSLFVALERPPVWGVTKTDGWEIVVFDQGGTNQLKNAAGCLLTTQQNAGTVPSKDPGVPPTDASATGDYLNTVLTKTRQSAKNFTLTADPSTTWVAFGLAKTQQIEFGLVDFTYTRSDTGAPFRTLILSRVMPRSGSQLSVNLSCPTAELEAARPALDGLTVLSG